tara:strand:- start:18 stop:533 length:516 start_codon:yes stop_codon:yes gene_type:complete
MSAQAAQQYLAQNRTQHLQEIAKGSVSSAPEDLAQAASSGEGQRAAGAALLGGAGTLTAAQKTLKSYNKMGGKSVVEGVESEGLAEATETADIAATAEGGLDPIADAGAFIASGVGLYEELAGSASGSSATAKAVGQARQQQQAQVQSRARQQVASNNRGAYNAASGRSAY